MGRVGGPYRPPLVVYVTNFGPIWSWQRISRSAPPRAPPRALILNMRIQATPKYPLGIAEPESGVHRALIGQRGLENYPITNSEGPNGYYLVVLYINQKGA